MLEQKIKRAYNRKNVEVIQEPSEFSINERFGFISNTIAMVARGQQNSAIICGSGGLGKSYSVTHTLLEEGYEDISGDFDINVNDFPDYKLFRVVKGYSTAKGLYKTLYDNKDSVIVIDDCDSVLKDATAVNLLKGALDSYSQRIISWNSSVFDSNLPSSFRFTGRVIFISNLSMMNIDQAIRSRSMCVDVTMTTQEKIERMENLLESSSFMPEFSIQCKRDALELITSMAYKVKELTLRTLIQVTQIRNSNVDGNWRNLAKYVMVG